MCKHPVITFSGSQHSIKYCMPQVEGGRGNSIPRTSSSGSGFTGTGSTDTATSSSGATGASSHMHI